uniref:Monocyte chemotactic protein n=2 Tax=Saimiriine herpesvirus 2 TaxID=10381 RepID=Q80BQ1_SHV2C|nr:monocyte chemotactic protein [Saimiriine gammaherpesvirus 2]
MEVENRPYPYMVSDANLLQQIKESSAEGLFKSFSLLLGKDVRESGVKFEALLGVYTNATQFVKFLETSLAVSCVNTEFKDLKRMTDGKIQFKINVPTIAHGDGRRPQKQKQFIIMKATNKHHIGAEIELSTQDLELLFLSKETPLDVTEYVGAVKTITSALQFGIDALERGLIDTVLTVKLRHAPPLFILKTLADPTYTERGLKKNVKSDLISMFKTHLVNNSFFLDKSEHLPHSRQYVLGILTEMIGAVCKETVFKGISTYSTANGQPISGVLETTDKVMRKLVNVIGQAEHSIMGPAAYANYVVRGENLVTAISYGKAMRNFDHFMSKLVDNPTSNLDNDAVDTFESTGSIQKTPISTSVVMVGNKLIALESLQRMYNETQLPYPLNRRMHYTYYFPVGLHLPSPKYSTSVSVKGTENVLHQSVEAWIVNKNNTLQCFNYQNALKSICHPRMNSPILCARALGEAFPDVHNLNIYGIRSEDAHTMNLYQIVYDYYDNKHVAHVHSLAQKSMMTHEEVLHPTNHEILRTEVHPFFDVYAERHQGAAVQYRATHRNLSGNLPPPLAPYSFQECRGYQFELASGLNHVIDSATMEIIQETAFDPAYPLLCYIVESMIHGQEEKFVMNIPLIALCIQTYWNNSGRLAFINSFYMLKFICTHMGNGHISKDAYSCYRKIYGELIAIEQSLYRLAGHENVANENIGQLINAILDKDLLPPFAYNDIFTNLLRKSSRHPVVKIGMEEYDDDNDQQNCINIREKMEDLVGNMVNIYQQRNNTDHSRRYVLDVGELQENTYNSVLEKIFYYVLLPVCTNGHVCGMGVDFENVALTLTYNGPVFASAVNQDADILDHLENGTLRDVLVASEIRPTVGMIRRLCTSFLTCPFITQAARIKTDRDPGQNIVTHTDGKYVHQTVLVNGFAAFAIADKSRDAAHCLFYPVPFNKLYCDPMVAATLHPIVAEFITEIPSQRNAVVFNLPPKLIAEYEEWHKSPMSSYVSTCSQTPLSLSTMIAMHLKLSPVSFICQSRHKIHPGFALTAVRTDEVVAEHIMYSSKASTSVFIGQPTVHRKEVRSDAVVFDINHELASLDTALGYSSTIVPAHAAGITTDMGIHCQDLFAMFPSEAYSNQQVNEYIKQKIGSDRVYGMPLRDPREYMGGNARVTLPGLSHGQLATCEVIMTPVTADITYFQSSNSPRGRASCVVSCDAYNNESAEKFLYDHSLPDPCYEFRSTINPWASQIGSLGDVFFNSQHRQMAGPTLYSPCKQFFNKEAILKNNKLFYTLVTEYVNRLTGAPATSNTDFQYVVINGTDVFLEQPCQFLQEAYPTLSASHRALLDEYMSHKTTHAPVHVNQYLVEEVAPMKRLLKVGNKTVY